MKLHLTATSERGKPVTKSGNNYLRIEIMGENRQRIGLITCDTGGLIIKNETTGQEYETLFKPKTAIKTYKSNTDDDGDAFMYEVKPKTSRECKHDWDNYGKCCDCGQWDTKGERN